MATAAPSTAAQTSSHSHNRCVQGAGSAFPGVALLTTVCQHEAVLSPCLHQLSPGTSGPPAPANRPQAHWATALIPQHSRARSPNADGTFHSPLAGPTGVSGAVRILPTSLRRGWTQIRQRGPTGGYTTSIKEESRPKALGVTPPAPRQAPQPSWPGEGGATQTPCAWCQGPSWAHGTHGHEAALETMLLKAARCQASILTCTGEWQVGTEVHTAQAAGALCTPC